MIVVKKKMKKPLIIVILAAALVVFTVAAILLNTFLLADSGSDGGSSVLPDPDVLTEIGESVYAKNMVAYPRIERSQMDYINITTSGEDENGGEYSYGYTFFKDAETSGKPFILEYTDKDGESYVHYPPIISEDAAFDINDLYAIDQNDQYQSPKLTYLCSAIGTLYFNERIKLSDDAAAKEEELRSFGLTEDEHPLEIRMIYTDSNGEQKKHTILVGDKLISGVGYYFRVDGRDYVYSTYSSTLDYAFLEFSDYINPILTSAGLPQDNSFEPYLTTDFKQWKNTLYQPYENKDGEMVYPTVIADSDLVLSLVTKRPDYTGNTETGDKVGGYTESKKKDMTFDLSALAKDDKYSALINSFVCKPLGACNVSITLPNYASAVDLDAETEYTYEVLSIEAVVTSEGDKLSGTVAEGSLVKISYHLYKGGEKASDDVFYGVVDLSSELISEEVKSNLVGKAVGTLDTPYTFVMNYDTSNTVSRKVEMVITEITGIEDAPRDENDELKVVVGCKVAVRCHILVDGEQSGAPYSFYFEVKENPTESDEKALTEALLGKTVGKNYNIKIDAYSINAEIVADFTTYEIDEAKHFVTKEEIVSFEFQQASERDAYYGESLYINTMQNPQYKLYALNASSCESVVRVFGGLLENANTSDGLIGIKTVDVVLTPEKMLKYGLYAHEVYFELPRGITAVEYNENESLDEYLDTLDDYQYLSTLGFTLYISEEDPITKNRYIASDLYDVVVEISGENFKFLDYSFVDFYARKSVFLMNIRDIEAIKTEFFMDDVQGAYTADLDHLERYVYNNRVYTKNSLTEEQLAVATKIDLIDVYVSESGTNIETALTRYLAEHGITATTLRELYGDKYVEGDSVGTDEYKEFIETLFYTSYTGSLSEEEKAAEGKLVMKMSVELYEEYYSGYKQSPVFDYVFEFYRISDRKVKVKLSMQYKDGTVVPGYEVSDFYISSFSFKKLVSKYFDLMNARDVESDVPFSEESVLG